jgi:hypothetical protein
MLQLGLDPGVAFKSALVGVKLNDFCARCRKLLPCADPIENTRRANQSSLLAAPAFFDFNTFNARVINGSIPFSISIFLLSSLMSTGTPVPS